MNIFIHRRDLRTIDNTTLNTMLKEFKKVHPIFIFDPRQIGEENDYRSQKLVDFMFGALSYLEASFFNGEPLEVLKKLHKENKINSIGFNKDYSPFSKKRDEEIRKWGESNDIKIISEDDMLLIPPDDVIYQVRFTTFNEKNKGLVKCDVKTSYGEIKKLNGCSLSDMFKKYGKNTVDESRSDALAKLRKDYSKYNDTRDLLSEETSRLSRFINLGLVSIREVWNAVDVEAFRDELIWRDYYYHHMNIHGKKLLDGFRDYKTPVFSKTRKENFICWCQGVTGVPIVDAGMRQMNQTGYMENRARMITASFLVKNLGVDWKKGEQYFAQSLIDYNISANNGGWQWVSGSGISFMPKFRVFNPWEQSKKYDKDTSYIKKWVPELKNVPEKHIHNWEKHYDKYDVYYPPLVMYAESKEEYKTYGY